MYKNLKRTNSKWVTAGFIIMACFILPACKTAKKVTESEPKKVEQQQGMKPEAYLEQQIQYSSFSGKAQMHFENKDQNQDLSGNIRMQKGKTIWASVVALGIAEVARASITPDSLRAIVRIGKKAYALSYEEGLALIQAQVEFPVLQNLLIGNPLISDVPVKKAEEKDSLVLLTLVKDDFNEVLTYNKQTGALQHLELSSDKRDFKCTIRYEKYGPITNKQPFAFNRYIVITNKGQEVKLDLEFSKAELDVPVDVSFSIPDSYTRQNIPKK